MNFSLCLAAAAALSMASAANARDTFHKTTLQQQDFPGSTYRTVTVRTVIDPNGQVAAHTHPGAEMGYVLSGRGAVNVRGARSQPLAPGDSFSIPPGVVHSVRNMGRGPMTLLSTYVVNKSRPIASPAR